MKSMKVMLIAALAMAVVSGAANATVSATQQWHVDGQQVKNTSNGQTLCMTGSYYYQATIEVCGSNPAMQDIRRVNFDINRTLRLDADSNMYFVNSGSDDVYLLDMVDAPLSGSWEYSNNQLKSGNVGKCLDIKGGKNVPGAQLILTTCTK